MIQARKVKPQDLAYIFQNAEQLGFESEKMSNCLENMMVVIDNNEICGLGFYLLKEYKCILNWIYVKENFRRKQLGTFLIKTMLSSAEFQGAESAYIFGDCKAFFEVLGFKQIEDSDESKHIAELYEETYYTKVNGIIYKASLLDYFKPCSNK